MLAWSSHLDIPGRSERETAHSLITSAWWFIADILAGLINNKSYLPCTILIPKKTAQVLPDINAHQFNQKLFGRLARTGALLCGVACSVFCAVFWCCSDLAVSWHQQYYWTQFTCGPCTIGSTYDFVNVCGAENCCGDDILLAFQNMLSHVGIFLLFKNPYTCTPC